MTINQVQLKDTNIRNYLKASYEMLNTTSYLDPKAVKSESTLGRRSLSNYHDSSSAANFSIIENIKSLAEDNPLMTDEQHHVVSVIQRGLALAAEISDTFEDLCNLKSLRADNGRGILGGEQKTLFSDLKKSHGYVTVFTLANYVQSKLDSGTADTSGFEMTKPNLTDNMTATKCFLYNINKAVLNCVQTDEALGAVVKQVALDFIESLRQYESAIKHTQGFISNNYRSEMLDFEVNGFDLAGGPKKQALVMEFKTPEEVIGNRIAKYQMKKLAKMMMCYDPSTRKNPFVDLGGFIFTFMGDGAPGTGKTTLIQMFCGLMDNYCQIAGREFYYENFGVDQIDSYQGKSGQNARRFIDNVLNPNTIGFGTIDDIDQIAGKRGDKQSSGGQQEVTAVLMNAFAGANTVIRGNATFGMFSNYPENVDDALRQRASARYLVDGPQSEADYTDLFALLLQSRSEIEIGDVELYTTQQIEGAINKTYEKHNRPETEQLAKIFDKATADMGTIDTFEKFGRYLKMIKDVEPRFTGRAIKNIADSAKLRAMDIDLPDAWFEDADTFMNQPYDKKMDMIQDKAGVVNPEMLLQELHRYADSEFRYAANSDEAAIDSMVRDHSVRLEAQRRIEKSQ